METFSDNTSPLNSLNNPTGPREAFLAERSAAVISQAGEEEKKSNEIKQK